MGTDIHSVFQRKVDGVWQDVPTKYEGDRHYKLFAWIANVRNGHGFAGIRTHAPIKPLQDGRGFPEDFDPEKPDRESQWAFGTTVRGWMGDHSFGWLTMEEILRAPNPLLANITTGILSREEFQSWDGVTPPPHYCGGISGHSIIVCEDIEYYEPAIHTHVRVQWNTEPDEFKYFLDECRRLQGEYGEVRMVFGFDS